jgi:hypothetical protein
VLTRTFGGAVTIRIEDSAGLASRIRAVSQLPSGKIRRELIALGYPVVAYDRWLSFRNPWQKKVGRPAQRSRRWRRGRVGQVTIDTALTWFRWSRGRVIIEA